MARLTKTQLKSATGLAIAYHAYIAACAAGDDLEISLYGDMLIQRDAELGGNTGLVTRDTISLVYCAKLRREAARKAA